MGQKFHSRTRSWEDDHEVKDLDLSLRALGKHGWLSTLLVLSVWMISLSKSEQDGLERGWSTEISKDTVKRRCAVIYLEPGFRIFMTVRHVNQ